MFIRILYKLYLWTCTILLMDASELSPKEVGDMGERKAAAYLWFRGFRLVDRNVARKTGELDLVMRRGKTLHFITVKTVLCRRFPTARERHDAYDPAANLDANLPGMAGTAEWYADAVHWKHGYEIDGALVWLQAKDCRAKVEYLPRIL